MFNNHCTKGSRLLHQRINASFNFRRCLGSPSEERATSIVLCERSVLSIKHSRGGWHFSRHCSKVATYCYQVKSLLSFSSSSRFNITIQDLKQANKLWTNEGLWPGKSLRIPHIEVRATLLLNSSHDLHSTNHLGQGNLIGPEWVSKWDDVNWQPGPPLEWLWNWMVII